MGRSIHAEPDLDFDILFAEARKSTRLFEAARGSREGLKQQYEDYFTKAIAPRKQPSKRQISKDAIDLITFCEVSSETHYRKKLQIPIWPKGESGVTIGIGYDLGYATEQWVDEDWDTYIDSQSIKKLKLFCGVKGKRAKDALKGFEGVQIPWAVADQQFRKITLARFISETESALPNTQYVSDDSLGALVSLVYNRGASFKNQKERFLEMRNIYRHMEFKQFDKIPGEIYRMRRLWEGGSGVPGVVKRRELESALFRKGLMGKAVEAKHV